MTKRIVVVLGHIARAFDLNLPKYKTIKSLANVDIFEKIFKLMIVFLKKEDYKSIRVEIITSIGQVLLRCPERMRSDTEIENVYLEYLSNSASGHDSSASENEAIQIQILHNLKDFLEDDDNKMMKLKLDQAAKNKEANLKILAQNDESFENDLNAMKVENHEDTDLASKYTKDEITGIYYDTEGNIVDEEVVKASGDKKYDIKQLNDVSAGQGAAIIQKYMKQISTCMLSDKKSIRKAALGVIYLTAFGGLVHPKSYIPLLMAASADHDEKIRQKADNQLSKTPVKLIQSCALLGILNAFELSNNQNRALSSVQNSVTRGY